MKVNLNTVHMDSSASLRNYVEERVNKLDKFMDNIVSADVTLKEINEGVNTVEGEISLHVPGDTLFASSRGENNGKVLAECTDALKRQIKKYKEKLSAH